MSQVTIYLDDNTERKMNQVIEKSGVSKSRWIADLIREKTNEVWPENIKMLSGAWKDFPSVEEIRKELSDNSEREPF